MSVSPVCPVIDNEFHHTIVKVADNIMMKFTINYRTEAWKTDVS